MLATTFRQLTRKILSKNSKRRRRNSSVRNVTAAIEALEERKLLTSAAIDADGVLQITGSSQNDVIRVEEEYQPASGGSRFVIGGRVGDLGSRVSVNDPYGIGDAALRPDRIVTVTIARGGSLVLHGTFDGWDMNSINVQAGSGSDQVENNTNFNSTIHGGWGSDTIIGGSANDDIDGSFGNDSIEGGNGRDTIFGGSNDDELNGGAGDDDIDGGYGDDFIVGGRGDDTLRGGIDDDPYWGTDNDTIWGGDHDDSIIGGAGDDWLHGENGNDTLRGGKGHDRLSGGNNNDDLFGEDGRDALLGGRGTDDLTGGNGADRFLNHRSSTNNILDDLSEDVTIDFRDASDITNFTIVTGTGLETIGDADWSDEEILLTDRVFGSLAERTGNNNMLRHSWGPYMTWYNVSGANWRGLNTLEGSIFIDQSAFSGSESRALQTVAHEIGHNWHFHNWGEWLAISGWKSAAQMQLVTTGSQVGEVVGNFAIDTLEGSYNWQIGELDLADPTAGYTQSHDGLWWYQNGSDFYRDYGRTNPAEDFATAFAYNVLHHMGLAYDDGGWGTAADPDDLSAEQREKFDFIDDLFAEMAN